MTYPIEVINLAEDDLYEDILPACELLNSVQREFYYTCPPIRLRDTGYLLQPEDKNGYLTSQAFEYLREYRKEAKGHRPFLIGVIDGKLASVRWLNLFGSHEGEEGLAIVTLYQQEAFTQSRLQYLCYYLIRYALSFIDPQIKGHNEPEHDSCFFHFKRIKTDLIRSIASGNICYNCMKKLRSRLNPEDNYSIQAMIKAMKNPSTKRHADIAIISMVPEETVAVVNSLKEKNSHYQSRTGSLSDRIYYEGVLAASKGGEHRIACTQTLKQGNRPIMSAYSHITTEYKPSLVILFGIAGAIHKSVDVCDVVFADSIFYYDQRKETSEGTKHRGQGYNITPWLLAYLGHFFVEHGGEVASFPAAKKSKKETFRVLRGPIGSGEAVVADKESEIREWLTTMSDKTLALETEAGGLAEVFDEEQLQKGYQADGYLVVRAISDHADQEKNDDYRQACSDNGMIALKNLLALMPALSTRGVRK